MGSSVQNLKVVYEDNHLVVINKRCGDIVQADKTQDKPLNEIVKQYLKEKYNKQGNVFLGILHRLDRPTTGIVVFGKTSKVTSRLCGAFAQKYIQKVYWAVVKNCPEKRANTLTHYLVKNPKNNKSTVYSKPTVKGKKAVLDYKVIQKLDNYYLLKIQLHTGRHHQIRCQLAHIGCPIKGDVKYGFDRTNRDASIHLHAGKIEFIHPIKKKLLSVVAHPPCEDAIWDNCKEWII